MHQCWHPDPQGRPTFANLHKLFDYFLSRNTHELYPYIDMDCNAPYTYDLLAHKNITDYREEDREEEEEDILYLEEKEDAVPESTGLTETNDYHKDLCPSHSDEKLLDDGTKMDESNGALPQEMQDATLYDKLRVDHPFLVRMSGKQQNGEERLDPQMMLHDDYFEDYLEENIEGYCLQAFDEYNPTWLKKLSTITEVSCEEYEETNAWYTSFVYSAISYIAHYYFYSFITFIIIILWSCPLSFLFPCYISQLSMRYLPLTGFKWRFVKTFPMYCGCIYTHWTRNGLL